MSIRRLTTDDVDACVEVATDRGWSTPRAVWAMLLRHGTGYGFQDESQLAGTVIAFPHERLTFIGMMLVRQRLEGRGVGRALLERALAEGQPASALLATRFGRPLYEKVGFVVREFVTVHRGTWNGDAANGVDIESTATLSPRQIEDIIDADARAFGCSRRSLIAGMLELADRVAVVRRDGALSYAMASSRESETVIGPAIAIDDETALEMIAALASAGRGTFELRVPNRRRTLRDAIQVRGLGLDRELPLMTRGFVPLPSDSWCAVGLSATS
jgi:GNAT superfamily N-acetyltransferase